MFTYMHSYFIVINEVTIANLKFRRIIINNTCKYDANISDRHTMIVTKNLVQAAGNTQRNDVCAAEQRPHRYNRKSANIRHHRQVRVTTTCAQVEKTNCASSKEPCCCDNSGIPEFWNYRKFTVLKHLPGMLMAVRFSFYHVVRVNGRTFSD